MVLDLMEEIGEPVKKHFFVSYNGRDKPWAEWIAWILEEAGYSVIIQAWDFRPGSNFVLEMQNATVQAEKTIAVLSNNYLNALYTHPEWAAAFAQDPTGEKGTLIPIRVAECEIKGLLQQIVYADVVNLSEAEAKEVVLGALQERAKPTQAPNFPGVSLPFAERITPQRVDYPGAEVPDLAALNRQFHQQQRGDVNPFQYGAPVSPDRFYGRVSAIADVKNRIGAISPQCVNIVGLRRSGKSSFLRYIKERPQVFFQDSQQPLIVLLDLQNSKFHDPYGLMEGLRRGIKALVGTEPWGRGDNIDPYEVEDALLELKEQGYRLIVILDDLESIGYRLDKFQNWGEDWRSKASEGLFSLVVASRHPLSEIYQSLGLTSPFGNIFSTTVLGALEIEAWEKLLRDGFSSCGTDTLNLVDNLAGRLPFYTQMAAALIWQYGDVEVVKKEFQFQVAPRWGELWKELSELERHALRVAAGKSATAAAPVTRDWLQRYGLLGTNGELFSDVFAEFVRGLQ